MKKHTVAALRILQVLLITTMLFSFASCGTMPSDSSGKGSSLVKEYAFLEEITLEPGQIHVVDRILDGETYTANAFYASIIMSKLEEVFEFSKKLSPESLQMLTAALCKNIPITTEKKELRFIVVGKYFNEKSDLYIVLNTVGLKEGAVPGKQQGIRYLTNAFNFTTQDKETGEIVRSSSGYTMNGTMNFTFGTIPYDNGDLVTFSNLAVPEPVFDTAAGSTELGNMMDVFVKDQYPDNDTNAREAYKIIAADKSAEPSTKLLSELNYFLFLLKHGSIQDAEEQLKKLPGFLPENAHESFVRAVSVEAPYYLDRVKNYPAAAIPVKSSPETTEE